MTSLIYELILKVLKAKNRKIKILFFISIILGIAAVSVQTLGEADIIYFPIAKILTLVFGIAGLLLFTGILMFSRQVIVEKEERKIEEVERKYEQNPEDTKSAWDLARIKLESYLNRNLRQVRSIFLLPVTIIMVGFIIISYGIFKVYESPENLEASILVTCSGVLVNFIGATFLFIYKSTMSQAKEYVSVLERINAVGMSIQILENIENKDSKLKDETSAEVAKELLKLYGSK